MQGLDELMFLAHTCQVQQLDAPLRAQKFCQKHGHSSRVGYRLMIEDLTTL